MKRQSNMRARRISTAIILVSVLISVCDAGASGRIVAANDDWIFSNTGFGCGEPGRFAQNICAWFTGGRPGRFLVYSTHFGLTGSSLSNAVVAAGHTWVVDASASFTLTNLSNYDGVFLGWSDPTPQVPPVDFDVLRAYIGTGGNAYVESGSVLMAGAWNPFLTNFGLAFALAINGGGCDPIADPHPIFAGVTNLYRDGGTSVLDLDPADGRNQVVAGGLFGLWTPDAAQAPVMSIRVSEVAVCWTSVTNATYRVEYRSDLTTNMWVTLRQCVPSGGTETCVYDQILRGQPQRFYRVVVTNCVPGL